MILAKEPGLHKAELRRRLGVAPEVAEHHLRTLAGDGHVLVNDGVQTNQTVCFRRDQAHLWADEDTRVLWGRHTTRGVAALIADGGPTTSKEVAEALDLSVSGVRHHIQKLQRFELVEKVHDGTDVFYEPRTKLEAWMLEHGDTVERP